MSTIKLLALSIFLMISLFILKFNSLPLQIPLFYSRADSRDTLVNLYMILLLPICLTVLIILNQILNRYIFKDNLFVEKIIYYLDISIIIFFAFIFFKIIFLVS